MKSKILIFSSLLILGISVEARAQWNLGGNTLGAANSIGSNDSYDVFFETNNTERMRIMTTTGYVGIGTSSPSGKLDVRPNSNASTVYFTANSDQYPIINMGGNSSVVSVLFSRTNTAGGIYLGADADAGHYYMRGSGNVLIGTSSQGGTNNFKLYVAGNGSARFANSGGASIDMVPGSGTSMELYSTNSSNYIDFKGSTHGTSDFWGRIKYTDGTGFAFQTAYTATDRLVITDAGNVGIGSSAPAAKLTVKDGTNNNLSVSVNPYGYPTGGMLIRSHDDANATSGEMAFQAQQYKFADGPVKIGNTISAPNHWFPGCTSNCNYSLYVENGILTERVKVAVKSTSDWSDFVFADDYVLPSLDSVETYIHTNKHLQGISSAEEMVAVGNDLGTTDKLLLEKIENLYLYTIELNKQIKTLTDQADLIELLKAQNELLKSQNELLILQTDEKR
jgi:hypothetical protein